MNRPLKNPMLFLGAVGAGGIAVAPFVYFQYAYHQGKGLISYQNILHESLPTSMQILFRSLEGIMFLFMIIHYLFSMYAVYNLVTGEKPKTNPAQNPFSNLGNIVPMIGFGMNMNVFIGVVRFFIPSIHQNLQHFMLPALLTWILLWIITMKIEVGKLKSAFSGEFKSSEINFGWLMHPIALAMVTVTGTGFAAMAQNLQIASVAAFLSLISGSFGFLLFLLKIGKLFSKLIHEEEMHFEHLPGIMNVIPYTTLATIGFFRLGHFFEHQLIYNVGGISKLAVIFAFTFEAAYILFGFNMLKDFLKSDNFKSSFKTKQWGMTCQPVAFAVLGGFFIKVFTPNIFLNTLVLVMILASVSLYSFLLWKQFSCFGLIQSKMKCN